MKQKLLRCLTVSALVCGVSFAVRSQEAIEGYFRVQSALGTADNSGYVEVRGPFTTAPDVTKDAALTSAGTVMRLRAFPEKHNGEVVRYKIGNLSSQGIEVFGTPQPDYMSALMELASDIDTSDFEAAAYTLQRKARELGYIASGRIIVQALFQVVASRLDQEISSLPQDIRDKYAGNETLEEFAIRFNNEVSANIDLHAYLEPVADGQYRLFFRWIDCTSVSEFYLANEQNKKSFELGFECMRRYMANKEGLGTGQFISGSEAAMWKSWGYDIDVKYHDCLDAETGNYVLTYEQIFADHEVLYNWLKMYIERFLDPAKAPDAEILGINFKAFATEMQRHAIMQGFLKYIPSIQEGQKLYLTNGRFTDGVNTYSTIGTVNDNSQHFGLLAPEQALAAGDAAIWNVIPMDETDNYFAIDPVGHRVNKPEMADGHLLALYVDFPFEAVNTDNMTFFSFGDNASLAVNSTTLKNLGEIHYVTVDQELEKVARRTPVLIETKTTSLNDNIVRLIYEPQESDYNPETNDTEDRPDGFEVSDDEVAVQHAPHRVTVAQGNAAAYAVLFSTPADETALRNLWNIDADLSANSVYTLTTREGQKSAATEQEMRTPWFTEAASIPANHAFLITESVGSKTGGLSLDAPADEMPNIPSAITDIEGGEMQPDVIYDLQGRRAPDVLPGHIYILNGKKILVK